MYTLEELAGVEGVIRLKDENHGRYLTACDNQRSITLSKPSDYNLNSMNTEWRLELVSRSNHSNYVGQVRLWSIFNKMLCFHGDPANYRFDGISEDLRQTSRGPTVAPSDVEWRFELKTNLGKIVAQICRWSHKEAQMKSLSILSAEDYNGDKNSYMYYSFCFEPISYYPVNRQNRFRGTTWMVEVVKKSKATTEHQPVAATHFKKSEENELASPYNSHSVTKYFQQKGLSPPLGHVPTALTQWQVGQVYFIGHHADNGAPFYSTFVNSGGNHNGSGVQTNGNAAITSKSGYDSKLENAEVSDQSGFDTRLLKQEAKRFWNKQSRTFVKWLSEINDESEDE